jgi:hypothetical protein
MAFIYCFARHRDLYAGDVRLILASVMLLVAIMHSV